MTQENRPSALRPVMRRKAVALSSPALIREQLWQVGSPLPLVIEPTVPGVELTAWAEQHRSVVEKKLLEHGALLFRDFGVRSVAQFEQVIATLSAGALEYMFRASPRTRVGGNIYTSTDYPADQMIFPHNEHSYSPRFPLHLFFFCQQPAETRGETPIGATREVMRRIPTAIRERFRKKRILYVRNYGDGFGLPWQTAFQTEDPAEVDAYCASVGITTEWKSGQRLRTSQIGPALVRHPRTGEAVWFNHGTFFHVTTLPKPVQDSLLGSFGPMDLPTNTFYGDGTPIEPEVLHLLREAYLSTLVKVPWQAGDILFLDNILAVHGREPFTGPRVVLTGMAEALRSKDVALEACE